MAKLDDRLGLAFPSFRSTFPHGAAEATDHPKYVVDAAVVYAISDSLEAAASAAPV
jgi:hypothetical protein